MKRVAIITGGLGTTGSELVKYIVDNDLYDEVHVVDNQFKGKYENLFNKDILGDKMSKVNYLDIDIRDSDRLLSAVDSIMKYLEDEDDYVDLYNLAAVVETRYFYTEPEFTFNVNVLAAQNVMNIALEYSKIRAFLSASTSEIYGYVDSGDIKEEQASLFPSPLATTRYSYAVGKLLNEYVLDDMATAGDSPKIVHVRYANTYGISDMEPEHIIPYLIDSIHKYYNSDIDGIDLVEGYEHKFRSFLNQKDSARYTYEVMTKGENFGVYNIGSKEEICIKDLVGLVHSIYLEESGLEPKVLKVTMDKERPQEPIRRKLNVDKLEALYGEQLKFVPLEDGISHMVHTYLKRIKEGGK